MKWPRRLLIALIFPVLAYLAVIGFLFFGQTSLLFPTGQVGPADPLPPGAERLEITAGSGERLRGVHLRPARPGAERLLILGFAGNGWNAQSAAIFLAGQAPRADVVVFHYRGYAPSEGRPSAGALRADAPLALDFARRRLGPARTILVGFSIGTGVAASLAATRPVDGLILVTPFDSLGRVAADHYPWLPIRPLFRHPMDAAVDLSGNRVPVAIIAAGSDTLVPPARTDALRHSLANLVFDRTISGAGHNDIYRHPGFRPAFSEALEKVLARP